MPKWLLGGQVELLQTWPACLYQLAVTLRWLVSVSEVVLVRLAWMFSLPSQMLPVPTSTGEEQAHEEEAMLMNPLRTLALLQGVAWTVLQLHVSLKEVQEVVLRVERASHRP